MDTEMLHQELDSIIRQRKITPLFQPIVDGGRRVHGYEALSRGPAESPLHHPLALFDTATRCGRLVELEELCRELAVVRFRELGLPGKLFLNVTPVSLMQPDHRPGFTLRKLRAAGLVPEQVVIELTEQHRFEDYDLMRLATEHYRAMGFAIAIDDLGAGYAGLRLWSELRPDYVKIDRHFVEDLHSDPIKREFVRSIHDISQGLQCKLIAEGIENVEEYQAVQRLGISLGQGFYFARPLPQPAVCVPPRVLEKSPSWLGYEGVKLTLADLARPTPLVQADEALHCLVETFLDGTAQAFLPVVDERGFPLGAVCRESVLATASPLSAKARHFLDPHFRFLGGQRSLHDAADQLLHASHPCSEFGILDNEGRVQGFARLAELVQRLGSDREGWVRHLHPLTLLPGSRFIAEVIERLLTQRSAFVLAYFDLVDLGGFNRRAGYPLGDQVLRQLADILCRHVEAGRDQVAHLYEDDMVVVFLGMDWKGRLARVLAEFDDYRSLSRQGETPCLPLLSVATVLSSAAGPDAKNLLAMARTGLAVTRMAGAQPRPPLEPGYCLTTR